MMWPKVRLKRVAKIEYGLGQPPILSSNGVAILRATNIDRGKFTSKNMIYAKAEDLPLARVPLLRRGEILVVRSGAYTGDSAIVTDDWVGSSPGYDLRVTPTQIRPEFLAYSLLAKQVLEQVDIAKSRAAQPHLNAEDLGDVQVSVPDGWDQARVVDLLDGELKRIDDLMLATRRQVGLLSSLSLEKLRVMTTGLDGGANSRPTGIEWMPKICSDWKLVKVGQGFATGSGTTPRTSDPKYFAGDLPWVNTGDLRDGLIVEVNKTVSLAALIDYPALRIYPVGSLVVAMYGATVGRVGILNFEACVNQACCVLLSTGNLSVRLAYYWFLAHRSEIVGLASGGGQSNISQDLVRSLRIPSPGDFKLQERVVAECDDVVQELANRLGRLTQRQRLLSERRQALITAAVTGQIDVSTASGRGL